MCYIYTDVVELDGRCTDYTSVHIQSPVCGPLKAQKERDAC